MVWFWGFILHRDLDEWSDEIRRYDDGNSLKWIRIDYLIPRMVHFMNEWKCSLCHLDQIKSYFFRNSMVFWKYTQYLIKVIDFYQNLLNLQDFTILEREGFLEKKTLIFYKHWAKNFSFYTFYWNQNFWKPILCFEKVLFSKSPK